MAFFNTSNGGCSVYFSHFLSIATFIRKFLIKNIQNVSLQPVSVVSVSSHYMCAILPGEQLWPFNFCVTSQLKSDIIFNRAYEYMCRWWIVRRWINIICPCYSIIHSYTNSFALDENKWYMTFSVFVRTLPQRENQNQIYMKMCEKCVRILAPFTSDLHTWMHEYACKRQVIPTTSIFFLSFPNFWTYLCGHEQSVCSW